MFAIFSVDVVEGWENNLFHQCVSISAVLKVINEISGKCKYEIKLFSILNIRK